jgi:hypothetical protein
VASKESVRGRDGGAFDADLANPSRDLQTALALDVAAQLFPHSKDRRVPPDARLPQLGVRTRAELVRLLKRQPSRLLAGGAYDPRSRASPRSLETCVATVAGSQRHLCV